MVVVRKIGGLLPGRRWLSLSVCGGMRVVDRIGVGGGIEKEAEEVVEP